MFVLFLWTNFVNNDTKNLIKISDSVSVFTLINIKKHLKQFLDFKSKFFLHSLEFKKLDVFYTILDLYIWDL